MQQNYNATNTSTQQNRSQLQQQPNKKQHHNMDSITTQLQTK